MESVLQEKHKSFS